MTSLVAVGVLILSALSIVCFAACKIRAKSFEVSTSVWKIASFAIKIISADGENRESARDRVELLGTARRVPWSQSGWKTLRRDHGLYYQLQRSGTVERAARDIDIFEAKTVPPAPNRYRQAG
jgi:hypothetical protein